MSKKNMQSSEEHCNVFFLWGNSKLLGERQQSVCQLIVHKQNPSQTQDIKKLTNKFIIENLRLINDYVKKKPQPLNSIFVRKT